ncbi:MAG: hypothetical protein COB41_00190 [Proteobacteria bacterium]|nr:MAG: hypothetical protein COB41_00190 [Pseudomonadota bacterium]
MNLPKGLKIIRKTNSTDVKLYDTIIVNITDNKVILNNGDWKTNHTRKCMNLALVDKNVVVSQKKGQWLVSFLCKVNGQVTIPFSNSMVIEVA